MADLWWCQFGRDGQPTQDFPASDDFRSSNFVDGFGLLLQRPDLGTFNTFDQVIQTFWGKTEYDVQIFCVADGGISSINRFLIRPCFADNRRS
jgi:hypothetical protein